jgi:serine-type D-Ala-D-Ala carboxypeptidase (penicillin-binding protein 5/6)
MGRRSLAVFWGCLLVFVATAAAAQNLDSLVHAKAYCIMDADTGKVLSSSNPTLMLPPASTLKVGTALIVVNSLKLTDTVLVSCRASQAPPSKLGIKPGEIYSVHDLLYALLLNSANDAARALGEKVSGSEERFACFMNNRLHQMGAIRTNFETASGLPAPGQYTCAQDLALIFYKAIQNPTLAKILSTKSYVICDGKQCRNHNRFLYTTDYAIAGKTGWTRASQHTYVGLFQNGDKRIIISLLGSPNKWPDIRLLIAQGFSEAGAPIAALPPLEEHLRKTADGYAIGSANPTRYKSKPRHRSYYRQSHLHKKGLVRAGMVSGGCKSSRSLTSKRKSRSRIKTSTCSSATLHSGG